MLSSTPFLLLLLSLFACSTTAFEASVPLHGASHIRISSELNLPLSVATDIGVPLGTATILVGSTVHVTSIDSIANGDIIDISITSDETNSSSSGFTDFSKESTSPGNMLQPALFLIMITGVVCWFSRNKLVAISICFCVFSLAAYSLDLDNKIVITISPFEDIDKITVLSPESVIVAQSLVNRCEAGSSLNHLSRCHSFVCDIDDSDCISPDFLPVGVLLALNDNVADNYHVAVEQAATEFGKSLPRIQLLVANTGDTSDSAVEAAKRLYESGCTYFIGPMYSGNSIAVLEWANTLDEKLMFLSPSGSSSKLEDYENYFSLFTSNHEFGKAICNYLSFSLGTNQFQDNKLFVISANIEYTNDLFDLLATSCGRMRYEITHVASYDQIESTEDAIPIINSLNSLLDEEDDLETVSILQLGFQEIIHFLDAADLIGGKTQQVRWFTSDAVFDDSVLESPDTREIANVISLSGLYYVGYRAEQQVQLRSETLRAIVRGSGSVDFLSTFVHDATMLMYLTLERMGTLLSKPAVFPSYVEQTAGESYGVTGYLGLTPGGFRVLGEYMAGTAATKNQILDMPWQPTVFELYEGAGLPALSLGETVHFDIIKYYEFNSDLFICNTTLLLKVGYQDYLGRDFLVTIDNVLSDTKFLIPKFSDFVLNMVCGDVLTSLVCPGGTRNDYTRCLSTGADDDSEVQQKSLPNDTPPQQTTDLFEDLSLPKQDNMFDSYDGAKGTTQDNAFSTAKPLNLNLHFP